MVGPLHTVGAIATWRAWPPRGLATAGLVLLAIAGTGLTLVGLAPENVDLGLHTVGALYGIVCPNVAMVVLGAALQRAARGLGVLALAAGIAGLAGFVLFIGPGPASRSASPSASPCTRPTSRSSSSACSCSGRRSPPGTGARRLAHD